MQEIDNKEKAVPAKVKYKAQYAYFERQKVRGIKMFGIRTTEEKMKLVREFLKGLK